MIGFVNMSCNMVMDTTKIWSICYPRHSLISKKHISPHYI